ncbi:hypothetical protein HPP92_011163 [Vanilla planifolia]|uniref:JmjC domain-containing protein n=1 Tax=Vanilla planifolia TaxID=51239 RepID=A0A835QV67_VANPL|nr:hypothetical protein HPP92_011163 [Vanilla planifolia]
MEQLPLPRDRRQGALGVLNVLSDELICAILELLSPSDLGRLSCVSSVLYIFCNEEPLWMNLCLRLGGQVEYMGSWKRTILYREKLCTKLEELQREPLHFDGFSSLFLYRRWYRCFATLNGFSLDKGDMERINNAKLEELNCTIDEMKPVLLTEVAKAWPARSRWTMDQFLSNYGDVAFRISQRSSKKITMKFKDYISYMKSQHDEDPLYVFDDKFGENAPALLQDYSVPHLFEEDFFDVLDYDQRPPFRWLIIGPERSGASWHVDPGLTSAWNTLLCGRKRWALYPPGRVPVGVTVHVSEDDGDVNIESPSSLQWWLDIYPLLADHDKPLECTQLPGETIFVPSGWWHCVLNLETTIAVTQNFANASNFEFICLDMAPGHAHKGVSRAGLLAIRDVAHDHAKNNSKFETTLSHCPDMNKTHQEKRLKVSESVKEQHGNRYSWNSISALSDAHKQYNQDFSYDIDFLSAFLDKETDHYNSTFCVSNIIGERELRAWLHKLWVTKPAIRQLIWKGACLALNVEKWATCLLKICAHHNLPSPLSHEKFPVGTGSNPVFLVSGYVVKIFVEGGRGYSMHSLGTELEFKTILDKVKSPLMDHVPEIVASGFVVGDHSDFKIFAWDGREVPDMIANTIPMIGGNVSHGFPFGVWSKKKFQLENLGVNSFIRIWPYIVSRRCRGDILANVRDQLSENEAFHLASFLGEQLRHLHLLPLPNIQVNENHIDMGRTMQSDEVGCNNWSANAALMETGCKDFDTLQGWKLVMATLDRRKANVKKILAQWGDPIPAFLMDKVEEYLPHDVSVLFDVKKGDDGSYIYTRSPTWIHSDIMDDNIHMKQCCPSESADTHLGMNAIFEEKLWKWRSFG